MIQPTAHEWDEPPSSNDKLGYFPMIPLLFPYDFLIISVGLSHETSLDHGVIV